MRLYPLISFFTSPRLGKVTYLNLNRPRDLGLSSGDETDLRWTSIKNKE